MQRFDSNGHPGAIRSYAIHADGVRVRGGHDQKNSSSGRPTGAKPHTFEEIDAKLQACLSHLGYRRIVIPHNEYKETRFVYNSRLSIRLTSERYYEGYFIDLCLEDKGTYGVWLIYQAVHDRVPDLNEIIRFLGDEHQITTDVTTWELRYEQLNSNSERH